MKKKTRRLATDDELNITSMMDMMTIILVFLLKSFSATEVTVTASDKLVLPMSSASRQPDVALVIAVQKNRLLLDNEDKFGEDKSEISLEPYGDPDNPGKTLYKIADDQKQGLFIPSLFQALDDKRRMAKEFSDAADALAKKSKKGSADMGFEGRILLQIDKDIPFQVLRDIMFTAGQAQYAEFEFVVIKDEK
jgi:biopolymer transport protein ExbD